MDKPPITVLQELLVTQGSCPIYDYVGIKLYQARSVFVYRVACKNLSAEGTGFSKKEAKHNAAKNMLLLLSSSKKNETKMSPVQPSKTATTHDTVCLPPSKTYETVLKMQSNAFVNYVGLLQDFCVQRGFTNVTYAIVEENGPAHIKTYTMQAKMQSLEVKGTARCKKLAKQEAARMMLQKLQSLNGSTQTNYQNLKKNNDSVQEMFENGSQVALEQLDVKVAKWEPARSSPELTKQMESLFIKHTKTISRNIKQDYLIKNCHTIFARTYSNMIPDTMKAKMKMTCDKYAELPERDRIKSMHYMIRDITDTLQVKLQQVNVRSEKNYMVCLRLMSHPNITQFGIGETRDKATLHAMYNIILDILTLLN